MKRVDSIADLRAARMELAGPVGFVPTMGALHAGHAANVRRAREECAAVVASIFVNPTQFNDVGDLDNYPRTLEEDARLLEAQGCDLLFVPAASEIYPDGFATSIDPGPLGTIYEGAHRPGHFGGVCVVVCKLLNLVAPDRAYFGRKDAQQLAVIGQMARDLGMAVEIVPVETVRDPDGLALSSRNRRLTPHGRMHALRISAGLRRAREAWRTGERDAARISEAACSEGIEYDYAACVDPETFTAPKPGRPALVIVAATVDGVRLIDNVALPAENAD